MRVLVTGASGSLGRAFLKYGLERGLIERAVAYSRNEHNLGALREWLGHPPELQCLIGDVRDRRRLDDAMHRVDTVLNAAALKKVDEADPLELMKTNTQGAWNVIEAAIARKIARVITVSTDKSVEALIPYGTSKHMAEHIAVWSNTWGHPQTKISVVRYGNVWQSRGSVVEIWQQQVARGEPIGITDPAMTRFFITMPQAIDLILGCLDTMAGGEIIVPLGLPSYRLTDLAEALAPGHPTKIIGRRAGSEKVAEKLVADEEVDRVRLDWNRVVIEPAFQTWKRSAHPGRPAPEHFSYRSDTNHLWLSVDDLRALLAQVPEEG